MTLTDAPVPRDPRTITRPDPILLKYYLIVACFAVPLFPIFALANYVRYKTLRYRFDDEGVWMAWGLFFRREINLAYRRIQDIHVSRGIIQRWLGIANVSIQTASGSSSPEMVIEGLLDPDGLRDFLYARMRGARGEHEHHESKPDVSSSDPTLQLLTEIRDGVTALSSRVRTLEENQS
jgi:putative membrane protein